MVSAPESLSVCSQFVLDYVSRPALRLREQAGRFMYGQIATVAFVGIEARPVEVQVRISSGGHVFAVVGLPDKAVAESRERVRNALHAVGLGLPYKHITVNLAPADLPKEGSPQTHKCIDIKGKFGSEGRDVSGP